MAGSIRFDLSAHPSIDVVNIKFIYFSFKQSFYRVYLDVYLEKKQDYQLFMLNRGLKIYCLYLYTRICV